MTTPAFPTGTILGYPRIGRRRELKKAVEAFWAGRIDAAELEAAAAALRAATRERLAQLGLGRTDSAIPESFSFYDQVLDAAVAVGAIPTRFARSRRRRRLHRPRRLLHARPRRGRPRPARDDEVVRHQLPLPRARDRPGDGVLARERAHRARVRRGEGGRIRHPPRASSARSPSCCCRRRRRTLRPGSSRSAAWPTCSPSMSELLAAADGRRGGVGAARRARARQRVHSRGARDAARRSRAGLRACSEHRRRGRRIFVAAPYGSLGDAARRARGIRRRGDRTRPRARLTSDRADGCRPHARSRRKTIVAGVIDGHNIWRGDLAGGVRECCGGLRTLAVGRSVDVDLAAARSARRRRRDEARPPRRVARLRRPEGRAGRDAGRRPRRRPRPPSRTRSMRHPPPSPNACPLPGCATAPCVLAPPC